MSDVPVTLIVSTALMAAAGFLGARWVAPAWDELARRRISDLLELSRTLSIKEERSRIWLRAWGVAMAATPVALAVVGVPLLIPPALFLLYRAPRWILEARVNRRRRLLRDQLVGATVSLANSSRAGQPLARGLEMVADESPEPLAGELRRIVADFQLGRPLPRAIEDASRRLNLDGFTILSHVLLTCLDRGGKVTDALGEIGRSLREEQRLERKIEAETANGRLVGLLLSAFPFVFLAGLTLVAPDLAAVMFSTWIGQAVLVLVVVMVYASVVMTSRILAIDA